MTADDDALEETDETSERVDAHLDDLADGAGCTEIWEYLSRQRTDEADGT